jgi:hypothetical protein
MSSGNAATTTERQKSYPISGLDRPLEFQEVEALRISIHSAHEWCQPVMSRRHGRSRTGRIKSTKNTEPQCKLLTAYTPGCTNHAAWVLNGPVHVTQRQNR